MDIKAKFLLIFSLLAIASAAFAQNQSGKAVYVWDFTDRSLQKNEATQNFTRDFETALVQFGHFKVIERRQLDRLIAQADNEKKIAHITDLSQPTIDALKQQSADMVIFGEVYDDVGSGQISVTVTFEDYSGQKRLLKSTLISRGLVNDAASRSQAMEKLVKDIDDRTAVVQKREIQGLLFEIQKCTKSDKTVTIDFIVTNNDDDREIRIDAADYSGSRVFDDSDNECRAQTIRIANSSGGAVKHTLLSGLPTKCVLEFDDVSSRAQQIARLDIGFYDVASSRDMVLTFRNLAFDTEESFGLTTNLNGV